jgi:hypothetical protein
VLVTINEGVHYPLHSDGVKSRHHNLVISKFGINNILLNSVVPRLPLFGVYVPNVIVDQAFFRVGHARFGNTLTQEFVEFFTSSKVSSATNGPGEREEENLTDLRGQAINLLSSHLLDLSLIVRVQEAREDSHGGLGDVVIAGDDRLVTVLSSEVASIHQVVVEKLLNLVAEERVISHFLRHIVHPALNEGSKSETFRLHVNHTTAGNGGRGGD